MCPCFNEWFMCLFHWHLYSFSHHGNELVKKLFLFKHFLILIKQVAANHAELAHDLYIPRDLQRTRGHSLHVEKRKGLLPIRAVRLWNAVLQKVVMANVMIAFNKGLHLYLTMKVINHHPKYRDQWCLVQLIIYKPISHNIKTNSKLHWLSCYNSTCRGVGYIKSVLEVDEFKKWSSIGIWVTLRRA